MAKITLLSEREERYGQNHENFASAERQGKYDLSQRLHIMYYLSVKKLFTAWEHGRSGEHNPSCSMLTYKFCVKY